MCGKQQQIEKEETWQRKPERAVSSGALQDHGTSKTEVVRGESLPFVVFTVRCRLIIYLTNLTHISL